MKGFLIFFIFTVFTNYTFAQNKLVEPESCFRGEFVSHARWLDVLKSNNKNFKEKRFVSYFPESKFNERKSTLDCIDFKYRVDGLTVEGFYVKPKLPALLKLPVVIFNRGGNAEFGRVGFANKMDFISDIAAKGYIVLGSQYRGASARYIADNGNDEFGGNDVNDVIALTELLQEIPDADSTKIALLGWSRGAMQTYLAAKQLPEVNTIITIAGNSDARKALEWRPAMENVYRTRIPGFDKNRAEELSKRSVVDWVDELPRKPILLVHGTRDKRVHFEQSKNFADILASNKHPHKLIIYKGDNHSLVRNRDNLVNEVDDWLKKYM